MIYDKEKISKSQIESLILMLSEGLLRKTDEGYVFVGKYEIFIKKTDEHVKSGIAKIPPLTWFAISTKEFIKMGPQVTSQLWIRSSYARKGIMASLGR
jgi:deoxycytidine triphosphate deaminase